MIEFIRGDLLKADAEALVNPVNTVGVMGKGLALQFKKAFPEAFASYQQACADGTLRPGRVHVHVREGKPNPRYLIHFPTKRHWRTPSRLEDIRAGLDHLVQEIRGLEIGSVAIPPLGCGLGGLEWDEVKPLIVSSFARLPDVRVLIHEP